MSAPLSSQEGNREQVKAPLKSFKQRRNFGKRLIAANNLVCGDFTLYRTVVCCSDVTQDIFDMCDMVGKNVIVAW